MWCQSMLSVPLLLALGFFAADPSPWIVWLLVFGMIGYAADLWFFHVLGHLDVSVANAAWAVMALFLSVIGFAFFQESWTLLQTTGSLLILGGAFFLSFWHQHLVSLKKSLWLLLTLGVVYLPFYVMKKLAIESGESPLTVFYWMLFGRELLSFGTPLFFREVRVSALATIRSGGSFMVINAIVILCFFAAEYFGALSYVSGPLSLVAIVSNIQPFVVMLLAWAFVALWPKKAPQELMSRQSVAVKFISFLIVFLGLALLSVPQ
jgi:drug/metabolite transporter (DMT)-like permease